MKAILAMMAGLMLMTASADAQIIRERERPPRPQWFLGASAGWFQMQGLCDQAAQACWDFGSAAQYRASLEVPYGSNNNGVSLGFSYATSRVPVIWHDFASSTAPTCGQCDANVTVNQLMGVLHLGGGSTSFQQLFDLSLGTTQFNDFKTTSGSAIGPGKVPTDFTFSVAYGFGFSLTRSLLFTLQQEYGLVIHKRVSGMTNNNAESRTLRIGGRYAFFGR